MKVQACTSPKCDFITANTVQAQALQTGQANLCAYMHCPVPPYASGAWGWHAERAPPDSFWSHNDAVGMNGFN